MPFLTRLVNKLPNIETTVPSRISFRGEVATFIAANPKNTQLEGEANVYLDDFEGAQTNLDVKGFFFMEFGKCSRRRLYGIECWC